MTAQMLLMAFPILLVIGMKVWRPQNFSWLEAGVQVLFTAILIVGVYQGGKYLEMSATEYWTGTVNSKTHKDGWYQTSYSCNCKKSCTGSGSNRSCTETCETCYTDHYTREWYLKTTLGKIVTSEIDTESRMRRNNFDSDKHWNDAYAGEACSKPNVYTNYVRAADSSLVHEDGQGTLAGGFKGLIPAYPKLHGIYHLKRVHAVGVKLPDGGVAEWDKTLADMMKTLGAAKQINLFLVVVKTGDPSYIHALKSSWLGGNKNDAVIVIGSPNGDGQIAWADVFSWSKEPRFDIEIRGEIEKHGVLEKNAILGIIQEATTQYYVRRPMAEFEYLKDEIDPPTWVMVILIIISIGGSIGLAILFDRIDLDAKVFGRSHHRGRRSSFHSRRRY